MFYGLGFDPLDSAPALLAVIVGLLVWRRHRADRRARLFLLFAAFEFLLGLPLALFAANFAGGRLGVGASAGLLITPALVSATVFLHFGMSFPHARPFLRRGGVRSFYAGSLLAGLVAFGGVAASPAGSTYAVEIAGVAGALAVLTASIAGCVLMYRSYREMTRDARARYRVPVLGVLAGMIASFGADLVLGVLFATAYDADSRYLVWTANLASTASQLLLPLFFFMAASKYKLLEHHSQDYVAKL